MKNEIVIKRAIRMALALFLSVLISRYFSFSQGYWIPLTTAIVVQPTLSSTIRKGLQRFIGTLIGILFASILVTLFHQAWQMQILLIITIFLTFYLKSFNIVNYGIFVIPITMTFIILLSMLEPERSTELLLARCYDTTIGALVAVGVSFGVLPIFHKKVILFGIQEVEKAIQAYSAYLMDGKNHDEPINLRQNLEENLVLNRQYYGDSFYEFLFNKRKREVYKSFVLHAENLGHLLLGLDDLISCKQPKPKQLLEMYHQQIRKKLDLFDRSKTNVIAGVVDSV